MTNQQNPSVGFRIRAISLWGIAGIIMLLTHAAFAFALFGWSLPPPSMDELPSAIMIDLPIPDPGLAEPAPAHGVGAKPINDETSDNSQSAAENTSATDAPTQTDHLFATARVEEVVNSPAPEPAKQTRKQIPQLSKKAAHNSARKSTKRALGRTGRHQLAVVSPTNDGAPSTQAGGRTVPEAGAAVASADIPSTWKSALLAHLERYKRYPEAARPQRAAGTALLSFTIDRDGHVLDSFIARSSGFAPLDEESLSMLQRASPLPKMPVDMPGDSLQLVVPVHFSVQ